MFKYCSDIEKMNLNYAIKFECIFENQFKCVFIIYGICVIGQFFIDVGYFCNLEYNLIILVIS